MDENEIMELEESSENVDQTTEEMEEPVEGEPEKEVEKKLYTKEEVNAEVEAVIEKRLARERAKLHREYEDEYGELKRVLQAGTGKSSTKEIASEFRGYYESKGIKIPEKSAYSEADMKTLARNDAKNIIDSGIDYVVEEINRLADIGVNNLDVREKALLNELATHQKSVEQAKQLEKIGVSEGVYNSKEFKEFAAKFNPDTPIKNIYDIYAKTTNERPQHEKIGSLKNQNPKNDKDIFTPEEVDRLTDKDYDDPKIMEKVRRSMLSWK